MLLLLFKKFFPDNGKFDCIWRKKKENPKSYYRDEEQVLANFKGVSIGFINHKREYYIAVNREDFSYMFKERFISV